MKCSNCGNVNASGSNYCTQCNYSLAAAPTAPAAPTTPSSPIATASTAPAKTVAPPYTPTPVNAPNGVPASYPSAPTPAPVRAAAPTQSAPSAAYQQPYYYYQPITPKPGKPFTITDALVIIGFVLAVIGIFAYAFILLPASIAFSVTGFLRRTNSRTQGLSIAGIVVGVVACLIRLGRVLNDLGFIPEWLSEGIF